MKIAQKPPAHTLRLRIQKRSTVQFFGLHLKRSPPLDLIFFTKSITETDQLNGPNVSLAANRLMLVMIAL